MDKDEASDYVYVLLKGEVAVMSCNYYRSLNDFDIDEKEVLVKLKTGARIGDVGVVYLGRRTACCVCL